MKHRIIPAIMSGGSGTRLWPASTDAKPKQFHALGGEGSLFADTVSRVRGNVGNLSFAAPMIICNVSHRELVARELDALGVKPAAIVLEPEGRNTAAAGAIAAALAAEIEPDALVLLLPADHVITNRAAFLAAVERAAPFTKDRIVTFGIEPNRAEVGYGYIQRGDDLGEGVFAIQSFEEKPDLPVAEKYLASGRHSWNAGMFFFHPRVMLEEFAAAADIRDAALKALKQAKRSGETIVLNEADFLPIRAAPIDKAVMEKTKRAAVAPCDIGWADVGSWDEIWRLAERDDAGNATYGDVTVSGASNNLLRSDGVKLCVSGVDDLIVIATKDTVLILPRGKSQDVKELREKALKSSS